MSNTIDHHWIPNLPIARGENLAAERRPPVGDQRVAYVLEHSTRGWILTLLSRNTSDIISTRNMRPIERACRQLGDGRLAALDSA